MGAINDDNINVNGVEITLNGKDSGAFVSSDEVMVTGNADVKLPEGDKRDLNIVEGKNVTVKTADKAQTNETPNSAPSSGLNANLSGPNAGIYYEKGDGKKPDQIIASGNGTIRLSPEQNANVVIHDPSNIIVTNANKGDTVEVMANGQWTLKSTDGFVATEFMSDGAKIGVADHNSPLSVRADTYGNGIYSAGSSVEINNLDPNNKPNIFINADKIAPSGIKSTSDLLRLMPLAPEAGANNPQEQIKKAEIPSGNGPNEDNPATDNPQNRAAQLRQQVFGQENQRTDLKGKPVGEVDQAPPGNLNASALDPAIIKQAAKLAQNSVSSLQETNHEPFVDCSHGGANANKAPSRDGYILA
jgi:hypothetical protein